MILNNPAITLYWISLTRIFLSLRDSDSTAYFNIDLNFLIPTHRY